MEDKESSENSFQDFGKWIITNEQIAKIKNLDQEAIYKFFTDNYTRIKSMAYKFRSKRKYEYVPTVDDLINQVYIDLPYYNFTNWQTLALSIIKGTFKKTNRGGILSKSKSVKEHRLCSYDIKINNEDDTTFLDLMGKEFNFNESFIERKTIENDRDKKDKVIIDFLKSKINSKRTLNYIYCKIFRNLKDDEILGDELDEYFSRHN